MDVMQESGLRAAFLWGAPGEVISSMVVICRSRNALGAGAFLGSCCPPTLPEWLWRRPLP